MSAWPGRSPRAASWRRKLRVPDDFPVGVAVFDEAVGEEEEPVAGMDAEGFLPVAGLPQRAERDPLQAEIARFSVRRPVDRRRLPALARVISPRAGSSTPYRAVAKCCSAPGCFIFR